LGRDVRGDGDDQRPHAADPRHTLGSSVGTGCSRWPPQGDRERHGLRAGCRRRRTAHRPLSRRKSSRDLQRVVRLHVRPALPTVDRGTDLDVANDEPRRWRAYDHARRHRRSGQSVHRRLRADYGREQPAIAACWPRGYRHSGRWLHVHRDLERSDGPGGAERRPWRPSADGGLADQSFPIVAERLGPKLGNRQRHDPL
jgi:hypothetical protein